MNNIDIDFMLPSDCWDNLHGIMAKVLDCGFKESKFKL